MHHTHHAPRTTHHAFSLVELSIVLVILGLLVGGVLSGKSLIRAAQLRSVSVEYQRLFAATQTFKGKYFALPGDMTNATQFWGQAAATGAACREFVSTDAKTCDGDGNSMLTGISGSYEQYRFFQHLANAKLLEGKFDGRNDMPIAKLGSGANAWATGYIGTTAGGAATWFAGNYGNVLMFTDNLYVDNILEASEAWNIDTKLDDGKPATGKVVARGLLSACTDTASPATLTASYLMTATTKQCELLFRNQF